jgi:sigma-B regulation protein RsbU (phosphoserine phosphatase)
VGGDFFDIIPLASKRIALVIGDISGKGISAALLMAKLTTDIRLLAQQYQMPADVLTQANKALLDSNQNGMFATALYLLIDLKNSTYTLSNAGHQPPIVASSRFEGVAELDDATSVALGVVPDIHYHEQIYRLLPEDAIILYSDGINEAMNRQHHEYGMDRLRQIISKGKCDPTQIIQRIVADVNRYVGGAKQSDDCTIVSFSLDKPARSSEPSGT